MYLAIAGEIYDVSSARHLYGKGGAYHAFVGKDSSRAFAFGCQNEEHAHGPDCFSAKVDDLSRMQQASLESWLSFYAQRYPFVGYVHRKANKEHPA